MTAAPWASQQIAEFLTAVSSFPDEDSAIRSGLERAAEALEAEIALLVRDEVIEASIGFRKGEIPNDLLITIPRGPVSIIELDGFGLCHATVADLDEGGTERVVLIRSEASFDPDEISMLRSMARVLAITLNSLRTLARKQVVLGQLREREQLLEKLARIQRSISHRAPLQEVLDAITLGAMELMNDDVVGLRLIDQDDPSRALLVSTNGITPDLLSKTAKTALEEGAGGRAIVEQKLVVIEDYEGSDQAIDAYAEDHIKAAMAAPVYENGHIIGSLVVASHVDGRRYSESEREMLLALAEHASLALTDAKIIESMREAQRTKDMFLAMVSHELKTPLTVIMGVLSTLKVNMDRLPKEIRDDLMGSAYLRARDLERLIEMLLRGARAQLAGDKEMVGVATVIHQSIAGFNATRPTRIGDIPDVNVFMDPAALRQILGVFIENAISHSPPDSPIDIAVSCLNNELVIDVSNEGSLPAEISEEDLFKPFQRGADASSSGVGLGLYVAVKLAESMEGTLSARSADGRVTFTFTCPLGLPLPSHSMLPDLADR